MNWQYSPHKLLMFIGVCLGLALALTISGCEQNPSSQLSRVIQAFGDLKPLPKQTEKEYLRFATVFRDITGSPDDADEKLRYFRFGFKRLGDTEALIRHGKKYGFNNKLGGDLVRP